MKKSQIRKALLCLLWLLVPVAACAQGSSAANSFSDEAALRGRHPEIVRQAPFQSWADVHRIGAWHETRTKGISEMTVAIQGKDGKSIFAALVSARFAGRDGAQLKRMEAIDVSGARSKSAAMSALGEVAKELGDQRLHAVRPAIDWTGARAQVTWEIEFVSPTSRSFISVESGKVVGKRTEKIPPSGGGASPPAGAADSMDSNELHNLADFRAEATSWIGSAGTTQEKARLIFQHVADSYEYDSTIVDIENFTWADSLVRGLNGRRGICDEWAVVSVSYLRAAGIPARLKLMTWVGTDGKDAAHAALEYDDGGTWRHMDALWHAFNHPDVYRGTGVTNVKVMDNDFPADSRSTAPAWGRPDPTGDLRLHPYADFVLHPAYPGSSRPGYSH